MQDRDRAETGTLSKISGKLVPTTDAGGDREIQAWPVASRDLGRRVHIVGKLQTDNVLAAQSIRRV